jgi:hypothetical protein
MSYLLPLNELTVPHLFWFMLLGRKPVLLPIMRLISNDAVLIKRVMDVDAHGAMVPYVVPAWRAVEIDEAGDLTFAEVFYRGVTQQRGEAYDSGNCHRPKRD